MSAESDYGTFRVPLRLSVTLVPVGAATFVSVLVLSRLVLCCIFGISVVMMCVRLVRSVIMFRVVVLCVIYVGLTWLL